MNFNRINNILGWVICIIACSVYIMTMERTGSLWDCGEFASCAYKLQLPHPPGAPLFVMLGRLFMIPFEPNPVIGVNTMSALASGFTILFLFWTITHFGRKLATRDGAELTGGKILGVMAAGVVGALAYTFSDSFWFSAVEAEVYALSSFFTALVFWAILKWEQRVTDEQAAGIKGRFTEADRWIILIFFLMGLSIGVHLLNLLAIPAIVMVYYFKRFEVTGKGTVIAFLVGCLVTGIVQKAVIQWSIKGAGNLDVFFVNSLGTGFFVGFGFFFVLISVLLFFAIRFANKNNLNFLKLGLWSFAFLLLGFTTYFATMIRSNANPAIDMYNADNPMSLVGYVGREQYGDWPIVFGNDFTEVPPGKEGSTFWTKGKDSYNNQGTFSAYDYSNAANAHLFPRMWDFNTERGQHELYRNFGNLDMDEEPTMGSNLRYFATYQMGVMYMRYFMWNFAGKQNDVQGFGNIRDANYASGITFLDNILTGSNQSKMPDSISKDNKAQNKLYFLPFILGILGIIYQLSNQKRDFLVNGLFFFFTGIAIVLYLNQSGMQPRERDYAYVGSFYAFAIWIGLGVMFLSDLLNNILKNSMISGLAAGGLSFLLVPLNMAKQEWDDHDRSKKTIARDIAINYLESCPPNAILITFGDNDTYPLWYAQEVEGIRTDVRVINYSLLQSDWYFNQLHYKINNSDPINVIFSEEQVEGNKRNVVYVQQKEGYAPNTYYNLYDILKNYTGSDAIDKTIMNPNNGERYSLIPTSKVFIPVDSASITNDSTLKTDFPLYPQLNIDLAANQPILKNDLAVLSIIAGNTWKRPICFTSNREMDNLGFGKYLEIQGMCYRLVPYSTPGINKDLSYRLFMEKFKFGGAEKPGVYFDDVNRNQLLTLRSYYEQLASFLIREAEFKAQQGPNSEASLQDSVKNMEMARNLLKKLDKSILVENVPLGIVSRGNYNNYVSSKLFEAAYRSGEMELAEKIKKEVMKDINQQISFYISLGDFAMSREQAITNLMKELDKNRKENDLNYIQRSFARDWVGCYQIEEDIKKIEEEYAKNNKAKPSSVPVPPQPMTQGR